jgi:hypothetical protein
VSASDEIRSKAEAARTAFDDTSTVIANASAEADAG